MTTTAATRGVLLRELVSAVGDERVMIAVLPEEPVVDSLKWLSAYDRGKQLALVTYRHQGGGMRVLDLESEDGSRGQRWWKTEAAAREAGLNTIPIRYDGPAGDIPERYLVEHAGEVVLLRLASRGPWHVLRQRPAPAPEARGAE